MPSGTPPRRGPSTVSASASVRQAGIDGETRPLGRILLSTSNFPRWAGDSTTPFVLHLAQDLQELGWRVDVLAPHAEGAASREILDGVQVERFRYLWPDSQQTVCYSGGALVNLRKNRWNAAKLPALVFCEWAAVLRRLATRRYDLLHSHWILPQGFTGVMAAKPLKVPHVVTIHGGDVFALKGGMLSRFKRFALTHADAVTVNSSATRQAALDIAPGLANLHTVPMGVTEAEPAAAAVAELRSRYRRGGGPLVVFVGRLVAEKGADDLIRAMAILTGSQPDATALVVGDGQDRQAFERLAATCGVADRVTFTGWVQPRDVVDYLAAGDVFAGPSKRGADGWVEAQGLTFIEAMLAGTPVVATDSGGIGDSVRHEETGLLVPEGAPDAIAAAIARFAAEPALAGRVTAAGRERARERFTRAASARAFSDLLRDLSHGAPSNRREKH